MAGPVMVPAVAVAGVVQLRENVTVAATLTYTLAPVAFAPPTVDVGNVTGREQFEVPVAPQVAAGC